MVENKQQLDKVVKCIKNRVSIKKIIQYSGTIENDHNGLVMSVSSLESEKNILLRIS